MSHPRLPVPVAFRPFTCLVMLGAAFLLLGGLVMPPPLDDDLAGMPSPRREFRGVWIATVANIDWPSQPGLSVAEQQAELVALLDRAVALNLNTIIFQVRPAADAFYASPYEPWSEYLTGVQGQAPEPFYDPLKFAVDEAHKRGLELHAWFNPYRAGHPTQRAKAATHVINTQSEIVRRYGTYLWLDPGEPAAEDHSLRVILDVVRRYDIDGVHLDDYFYPYKEKTDAGHLLDFPDAPSWERAVAAGETGSRDDWRRANVDRFIQRLYEEVKREKPWVKVGISPFGIWRPGHPEQIRGYDAYAHLYADSRKWLENGWVDYFSPQLYWRIDEPAQSYPVLLAWWQAQNHHRRHLWPGNFTSRVGSPDKNWPAREIVEQILLTRAQPGTGGNVHFSMVSLMENRRQIADHLTADVYSQPALVPASPWLSRLPPSAPALRVYPEGSGATIALRPAPGETVWQWVVRARYGDVWTMDIVPGQEHIYRLGGPGGGPDIVAVSAVDRLGNESTVAVARRGTPPPSERTVGW